MEISEEDKRKLIEADLRGEWWEGLEDAAVREERRRRRKLENEDDALDAAAEQQELQQQQQQQQQQGSKKGARITAGDSEDELQQQQQGTNTKEADKHKSSSSSSSSSGDKDKARSSEKGKSQDPSRPSSSSSSSSRKSCKELRKFFQEEEELPEGLKHKPLTKLNDHRDLVNKVNRVKETIQVIENSKKIMAMVPTEKSELFASKIDWNILAKGEVLEKKLRPWVKKKVIEFMGADERLVGEVIDYILGRIKEKTSPKVLLEEFSRFLDDEAEGFLKHLWQLLLFEQIRLKK
ncbi:hypothetical protein ETH_00030490 [Eimeria tenella]|uniref:PWI domain-containing protein n=1 Tax=Eimeria tenella TaxID=5802 RepID=U6L511_EIMTE|nr:hypothetical protein ETH_00030490 [Eimeria tenella]CDJ43689.1 hypothetical protein ETH_00030490 [Eimeria tenella]|eukprot:XP_013234438.1 hypothetical protein ETH_00030490 [Eimeria tenella]